MNGGRGLIRRKGRKKEKGGMKDWWKGKKRYGNDKLVNDEC